jgi:hypothetical protein
MPRRPDAQAEFGAGSRAIQPAASPEQRLAWFYRRTPFFDDRLDLYPVAREE